MNMVAVELNAVPPHCIGSQNLVLVMEVTFRRSDIKGKFHHHMLRYQLLPSKAARGPRTGSRKSSNVGEKLHLGKLGERITGSKFIITPKLI